MDTQQAIYRQLKSANDSCLLQMDIALGLTGLTSSLAVSIFSGEEI